MVTNLTHEHAPIVRHEALEHDVYGGKQQTCIWVLRMLRQMSVALSGVVLFEYVYCGPHKPTRSFVYNIVVNCDTAMHSYMAGGNERHTEPAFFHGGTDSTQLDLIVLMSVSDQDHATHMWETSYCTYNKLATEMCFSPQHKCTGLVRAEIIMMVTSQEKKRMQKCCVYYMSDVRDMLQEDEMQP